MNDRIYNWLDSHLSIARHYGGAKIGGEHYVIAYNEPGQPLVKESVLTAEKKAERKAKKKPPPTQERLPCT